MPDPNDPNGAPPPEQQPDPWLAALEQAGVPEQFRKPEAIGPSWREAQRTLTQTQQEVAALREQLALRDEQDRLAQESQQQRDPQYADLAQHPYMLAYQQKMEEGDYVAAAAYQNAISEARAQQIADQAVQKALASRGGGSDELQNELWAEAVENRVRREMGADWELVRERTLNRASRYQGLFPDGLPVEEGAKLLSEFAADEKAKMLIERSQAVGNQQQEAGRQQKLLAQGLTGQGVRQQQGGPVDPKEAFRERFKSVPRAFGLPTG